MCIAYLLDLYAHVHCAFILHHFLQLPCPPLHLRKIRVRRFSSFLFLKTSHLVLSEAWIIFSPLQALILALMMKLWLDRRHLLLEQSIPLPLASR